MASTIWSPFQTTPFHYSHVKSTLLMIIKTRKSVEFKLKLKKEKLFLSLSVTGPFLFYLVSTKWALPSKCLVNA